MRKQLFRVSALSILLLLAIASGYAQSLDPMHVNIPFQFTAANTTLPAGGYTVGRLDSYTSLVLIRSVDCKAAGVVLTNSAHSRTAPNQSKLVFNRYGQRYFLRQIWSASNATGSELIKSRAERELKEMALNREIVEVSAEVGK